MSIALDGEGPTPKTTPVSDDSLRAYMWETGPNTEPNEKPSLWDYVRAFFDSLPGPSSSV
jgi:hypothetical protein